MEKEFEPVPLEGLIYERTIKIPFTKHRVWVEISRAKFVKGVRRFCSVGINVNDLITGMSYTNGAWVLSDARVAFRVRSR